MNPKSLSIIPLLSKLSEEMREENRVFLKCSSRDTPLLLILNSKRDASKADGTRKEEAVEGSNNI